MNAPEPIVAEDTNRGLYQKFNVTRIDGSDAPGERNHGHRYLVLDLDKLPTDAHAKAAVIAYAESCEDDYPQLAADLRSYTNRILPGTFVTVPETTLPNGTVVPAFRVGQYHATQRQDGTPWVEVNYHDARAAAGRTGLTLITETQWLAIAHNIAQQPINWTSGTVGEGKLFQGMRNGNVDGAQPHSYEPEDADERRWHELSNGERVYDFSGHIYSWVFDDVQGDEDSGLINNPFEKDSPSLTTAPASSFEKGVGWMPSAGANWSGHALCRGGCWSSGDGAGVFYLYYVWPDVEYVSVGFRCTKSL
jgi:hypothetical protein